jgi:hypothetical protein
MSETKGPSTQVVHDAFDPLCVEHDATDDKGPLFHICPVCSEATSPPTPVWTYWLNRKGDTLHLRGCGKEPPFAGAFPEYDGLSPGEAISRASSGQVSLRPHSCVVNNNRQTDACVQIDGCCATHSRCFVDDYAETVCSGWPCPVGIGDCTGHKHSVSSGAAMCASCQRFIPDAELAAKPRSSVVGDE